MQSLSKASVERKEKCVQAIDGVLAATRRTRRYSRERDAGRVDAMEEAHLSVMWTDLGARLEAVGLRKLAKRCDVKGLYWAYPDSNPDDWWDAADITLESVERLARQIKADVRANGAPKAGGR